MANSKRKVCNPNDLDISQSIASFIDWWDVGHSVKLALYDREDEIEDTIRDEVAETVKGRWGKWRMV
jgi:hypothetical protein